jgi:signal transduction histidine kinase
MAMADGDRMKQVFWNFCENAVRAMGKGGALTIGIAQHESDWEFTFADTGPGMSPEMIEKIFEPFQSGFEGGTGLGLAIVYQIVQAHEGKVFARSKPGQGCTFVLQLKRAAEHEHVHVATPAKPKAHAAAATTSSAPVLPPAIGKGAQFA